MQIRSPRPLKRLIQSLKPRHAFLKDVRGVVHVGANKGQERELYDQFGLDVLWVEPIPEIFDVLSKNLAAFPRQRALQHLVTDRDDEPRAFHVSDNEGASSSVFELGMHKDLWPNVDYDRTLELQSITLATLIEREGIDIAGFDALVMDTQGSELLVLKGAEPLLEKFRYVKTEVADFEAYAGCCQVADIERFLVAHGYRECHRRQFAVKQNVGSYYDIVYRLGVA